MGYLDSTSITVDAILTKQGRRLLAEGKAINVSYFCVSDTGVDYNLWNVDHPSGSAYYGEAIEDLPQMEALPNAAYFLRNKLVTLDKDTTAMPLVSNIEETYNFGKLTNAKAFTPTLLNHSETAGYYVIVPDISQLNIVGGARRVDFSPNLYSFIMQQETETAAVFDFKTSISISPKAIFETDGNTQTVVFISKTTEAWVSCQLQWDKNLLKAPVTNNPTR